MEHTQKSVKLAANRCPFCHEDVEATEAVACQQCLARHHTACWEESGCCGSCSAERPLQPAPLPPLTREQAERVLLSHGYSEREVRGFHATLASMAPAGEAPTAARRRAWPWLLALLMMLSFAVGAMVLGQVEAQRAERRKLGYEQLEEYTRSHDAYQQNMSTLEAELNLARVHLERALAKGDPDSSDVLQLQDRLARLQADYRSANTRRNDAQRGLNDANELIRRNDW